MDSTAIREIQKAEVIEAAKSAIGELNLTTPVVALPNEMKVIDLEKYLAAPTCMRSGLVTTDEDSFVEYVKNNKADGSACFINPDTMSAIMIFDYGSTDKPLHGQHKATLNMRKTVEFQSLLEKNAARNSQRDISEWMEDWNSIIRCKNSKGDDISTAEAFAAVRSITIEQIKKGEHVTENFRESRSRMDSTEVSNALKMPAIITFICKPYEGLEERTFNIRVSVLTGGEKPTIVTRVQMLPRINDETAVEFALKIKERIASSESPVYIGTPT